jgi:hypothetical protein
MQAVWLLPSFDIEQAQQGVTLDSQHAHRSKRGAGRTTQS